MNYILKKINNIDKEKIMNDFSRCDPKHIQYMQMRGGHLNNYILNWAVDEKNNSYLFSAPKLEVVSQRNEYYFFFKGNVYRIFINSRVDPLVVFIDTPSELLMSDVKDNLKKAFSVFGFYGLEEEILPVFF